MRDLTFTPLTARDLLSIQRQPSQRYALGLEGHMTEEEAAWHEAQEVGWTARHEGRTIACFGLNETFPGVQGVGWALLAKGIGPLHLALSRFIRARVILASRLRRIEVFAIANDAESILSHWPHLDQAQLLEAVMVCPTRECKWAQLLGLRPAHVLRKFGAASETFVLFERIN